MASIYDHPETYDLEHAEEEPDVAFFQSLAQKLRPLRTLEVACGTGRLTRPLARSAKSWGGQVHGIDNSKQMLERARAKCANEDIQFTCADIRTLRAGEPFDLIVSACASLSHLLTIEDQTAAFRNIHAALRTGGTFVLAEVAPDYALLAESMYHPPKETVQPDGDFTDGSRRLLRFRSARYHADEQRLRVRYFYDYFRPGQHSERFVNDYDAHVYFPSELRLLFRLAGFHLENEWGDYQAGALTHDSRYLIFSGKRSDQKQEF